MNNQAEAALNQIRDWLKAGAAICATDPTGRVLEFLPDGSMHGGMTVKFEKDAPLLRLTGPNADGEFWLHVDPASGPKAGIALRDLSKTHICRRAVEAAILQQNSA